MGNLKILTLATIKTIKFFPLVLPATIVGLAVLAVEERRERNESVDYYGY